MSSTLPSSFVPLGVKLNYFSEFIKEYGGDGMFENLKTEDVRDKFVIPFTNQEQCSYVSKLQMMGHPTVGNAKVFISHAWKYSFLEVVRTLFYHFRGNLEVRVWFDVFSHNQHDPVQDFQYWASIFESAIKEFQNTVLVLSPWNDPIPLTRAWCLFELYTTKNSPCKFEIALSENEHEDFIHAMITEGISAIHKMITKVDCEKSSAKEESDKLKIFQLVQSSVGFMTVNAMILEKLRSWVIEIVVHALQLETDFGNILALQLILGQLYFDQNNIIRALKFFQLALTKAKEVYLDTDQFVLKASTGLASCYIHLSRYEEALELFTLCLKNDPDSASIKFNAASCYFSLANYDKAEQLYYEAINLYAMPGNHDDDEEDEKELISTVKFSLAQLYYHIGRYQQAEILYQEGYDYWRGAGGMRHPTTLLWMTNFAEFYRSQGKFQESEDLYTNSYELTVANLGPDHLDTLSAKHNLALLYGDLGRFEEAEQYFLEILSKERVMYGENNIETLTCLNNLGDVKSHQGKFHEALEIHKECHQKRLQTLGENHPDTLQSLNNLSAAYYHLGNLKKAIELCDQTIAIKKRTFPNQGHPDLLISLSNKASYLEALEKYAEAELIYKEIIERGSISLPDSHPDFLPHFNKLANLYFMQGRFQECLNVYQLCLPKERIIFGNQSESVFQGILQSGICYYRLQQFDQAESCLQEEIDIQLSIFDQDEATNQIINTAANYLFHIYQLQGSASEAKSRELLQKIQNKNAT